MLPSVGRHSFSLGRLPNSGVLCECAPQRATRYVLCSRPLPPLGVLRSWCFPLHFLHAEAKHSVDQHQFFFATGSIHASSSHWAAKGNTFRSGASHPPWLRAFCTSSTRSACPRECGTSRSTRGRAHGTPRARQRPRLCSPGTAQEHVRRLRCL